MMSQGMSGCCCAQARPIARLQASNDEMDPGSQTRRERERRQKGEMKGLGCDKTAAKILAEKMQRGEFLAPRLVREAITVLSTRRGAIGKSRGREPLAASCCLHCTNQSRLAVPDPTVKLQPKLLFLASRRRLVGKTAMPLCPKY